MVYGSINQDAAGLLVRMRMIRGVSRSQAAWLAGVATSTVARIETGDVDPTWTMVRRLAKGMGFKLGDGLEDDVDDAQIRRVVLMVESGSVEERRDAVRNIVPVSNVSPVSKRPGALFVDMSEPLLDVVARLRQCASRVVVSSLEAVEADWVTRHSFVPVVYASRDADLSWLRPAARGNTRFGYVLPLTNQVEQYSVVVDGVRMAGRTQGLLDLLSTPGRSQDDNVWRVDELRRDIDGH